MWSSIASGLVISFITQYEIRRGLEELRIRGQGRRKIITVERFMDTAFVLGLDDRGGEGRLPHCQKEGICKSMYEPQLWLPCIDTRRE